MALNGDQIERYSRQILVPEIGGRGQKKLLACRVRCLGASATLTTAADYLAAAGLTISTDSAQDTDLLLAPADASTADAGTLPAFIVGESAAGEVWYSRGTAADTCRECLREAAAAVADNSAPDFATPHVAGAALAVDVIAQVLEMASGDLRSVVVFSRGGRQRRLAPAATPCLHNSSAEVVAANQSAAPSGQP